MKDRKKAALFAIFLGWGGGHKFYLNDTGSGIFYIMLTIFGSSLNFPIGAILGWIDAFAFLTMSDERFDKKYNLNRRVKRSNTRQKRQNTRERRNPYQSSNRSNTRNRYDEYGRPKREEPANNRTYQQNTRERKRKIIKDNPFKTSGIKRLKDFELDLAEVDLQRALELSPDDIQIHFAMGQLYSLNEDKNKSFYHLAKAVELGFSDIEKIKTTDELAYLRIQPEFDEFERTGFRSIPTNKSDNSSPTEQKSTVVEPPKDDLLKDDLLLSQLNKLAELRKKGLLSEKEFEDEKIKLTRR